MHITVPRESFDHNKILVVFTWDDNSFRHLTHIGKLFKANNLLCTFYIVPGSPDFNNFAENYLQLSNQGFEIGSHSFTHEYMTTLSKDRVKLEIENAIKSISDLTGHYPVTFAFPNHAYNDSLLQTVKLYHLESRNNLSNSERCSLKTASLAKYLMDAVSRAIVTRTNLIFSGHSIITQDELHGDYTGEGYEPIPFEILTEVIQALTRLNDKIQIVTFAQAALRQFIRTHGKMQSSNWVLENDDVIKLGSFGITQENILELI